jgi:carboxylate-amine ligase
VREMDAQSRLEDVATIAALIRGLARHEAESGGRPVPSETIAWSAFRALRDGLDARIHHEGTLRRLPEAAQVAGELAASATGGEPALEGIGRILAAGNGAERHRRLARTRGVAGLVEELVAETTPPGDGSRPTG